MTSKAKVKDLTFNARMALVASGEGCQNRCVLKLYISYSHLVIREKLI